MMINRLKEDPQKVVFVVSTIIYWLILYLGLLKFSSSIVALIFAELSGWVTAGAYRLTLQEAKFTKAERIDNFFIYLYIGIAIVLVFLIIFPARWFDNILSRLLSPSGSFAQEACQSNYIPANVVYDQPIGSVAINDEVLPKDLGFRSARSVESVNTLICIDVYIDELERCQYDDGSSIVREQITWDIRVIDWQSKTLRSQSYFQGSLPEYCPSTLTGRIPTYRGNSRGETPDLNQISSWLTSLE